MVTLYTLNSMDSTVVFVFEYRVSMFIYIKASYILYIHMYHFVTFVPIQTKFLIQVDNMNKQ